MRTDERSFDFLSDQARRLATYVTEAGIDVRELIRTYERWRSAEDDLVADASPAAAGDHLSTEVHRRFGLKTGQAAAFEAYGDAIRAIVRSGNERARSEWHQAKLRALEGDDRDKKLLALRHLDSADFDDELMLAALIESLERDDDTLALTFAVTAGSLIDSSHKDVLRLLLDELHLYERRRQSRAAFFGVLLFHIYENHAGAVPPDWLISEWTSSVAASEDPASFAALVDLCALTVTRSADAALIDRLLSSDRPTEWLLAAQTLKRMDVGSVQEPLRRAIRYALSDARTRWSSAGFGKLAPQHAQWLLRTVDEILQ